MINIVTARSQSFCHEDNGQSFTGISKPFLVAGGTSHDVSAGAGTWRDLEIALSFSIGVQQRESFVPSGLS
jgi:hypothetical protein